MELVRHLYSLCRDTHPTEFRNSLKPQRVGQPHFGLCQKKGGPADNFSGRLKNCRSIVGRVRLSGTIQLKIFQPETFSLYFRQ
jgi:hypothetical protein